ncbi:MAG: hypothetical protein LBC71_01280 [Oscillospiraceae bacterium]|nr:hypothetical protein [Oscillospiraceae bacterium]
MKSKFVVTYPAFIFPLMVFGIAIAILIVILQLVFNSDVPYNTLLSIIFIALPTCLGIPAILIVKVFKITVNTNVITVRTTLGFKYSFDISEVTYVEKRVPRKNKDFERLFIRTSKKTLKLDTFMIGYDKMLEYLSDNGNMANSNKIINKYNILYTRERFTKE